MIYVDGKNSNRQARQGYVLIAESRAEFTAVEKKFGKKLLNTPKYNAQFIVCYITGDQRKLVLELGAIEITSEQLAEMHIKKRNDDNVRKEKFAKAREAKQKREHGE